MPPFGGQGMNTAARDVNNLGWKIAAVLAGKSSPALLDTYDSERRKQIRAIIDYSVLIGKFANVRSHWGARLRDLFFRTVQRVPAIRSFLSDMRYMPPPSIDDGVILSADKNRARFVGRPFPRLLLEKNGREVPIDDLFGEGFTLVGIGIETHILEQAAQHPLWQRWGVAQVSIGTAGSPKLAASSPTAEQLHNSICVVRPDLYIAATMAPANMNRAFDRIAALLAVPSDQDARG
jgi:3-(3-hydroxy-phenyl)propionate hydroxylase